MKKCNAFLVSVLATAALNAAKIDQVIVRQQWPWSTDVKVEYKLSEVTSPMDISLKAYNGDVELTLPEAAVSGDRYGVSDAVGTIIIDPVKAFGTGKVALANFKVKLTVSDSAENVGEVLYKIYDLENGSCEDVSRADLLNGKKGTFVTSYAQIHEGFKTTLSDVLIWTGVTNDVDYMTKKLVLRRVPKGTFTMGSPEGEDGRGAVMDDTAQTPGRETQHQVTFDHDYFIGVFEVTQYQFNLMFGAYPSAFSKADCRETRPVESVNYDTLRGYDGYGGSKWPDEPNDVPGSQSALGKLKAKITGNPVFDLPTEAQWEWACRAGTTTGYATGCEMSNGAWLRVEPNMSLMGRYAFNGGRYDGGTDLKPGDNPSSYDTTHGTARVGSYLPNALGLYDMHGNVNEWCRDWIAPYSSEAVTNPTGALRADGTVQYGSVVRVMRGGNWGTQANGCRSASRYGSKWNQANNAAGFRVCLTVE